VNYYIVGQRFDGSFVDIVDGIIPPDVIRVTIDVALDDLNPMDVVMRPPTVRQMVNRMDFGKDELIGTPQGSVFLSTTRIPNKG